VTRARPSWLTVAPFGAGGCFDHDTRGGGVSGVLDESNWEVVAQDPGAGARLARGVSVRLATARA
jgi:hypothetical protein